MNRLPHFINESWELTKGTFSSWYERDPFRSSTVIAYYTIFSLPGLGVIVINIAGYFYGTQEITQEISEQIEETIGSEVASSVELILANAYEAGGFTLSSLISIAILLFGATGVFYQIQQSLNLIWEVEPRPEQMLMKFLRDRLFSFGMILVIGFLLLVSLVVTSVLNTLGDWLGEVLGALAIIIQILNPLASLAVITMLFAAIFKVLPDVNIRWKDVLPGALVTAILFVIAEFAIGLYFTFSDPASVYGAAGSIILIMLWASYTALILLFGAEFTRVYTKRHGVRVEPSDVAVPIDGGSERESEQERQHNQRQHNQRQHN